MAQGAAKPKQVSQGLRAQSGKGDAKAAKLKEVVKVDLERVDNLVSLIGELVIVEAMIANAPELSGQASPRLRKHVGQMSKITKDLQDIGTRMRTVPVRGVFQKMARMVRDLSRKSGKAIAAEMTGEGTEMDRRMVEQIADPLHGKGLFVQDFQRIGSVRQQLASHVLALFLFAVCHKFAQLVQ